MKTKQKKWSAYIMVGNLKVYLRKAMTTSEIIKWLDTHCKTVNADFFMCGTQVFCECK
jgi:hypothetical protein